MLKGTRKKERKNGGGFYNLFVTRVFWLLNFLQPSIISLLVFPSKDQFWSKVTPGGNAKSCQKLKA
jgi:hypothetical protein